MNFQENRNKSCYKLNGENVTMAVHGILKKSHRNEPKNLSDTPDLGKDVIPVPYNVMDSLCMMAGPTQSSDS